MKITIEDLNSIHKKFSIKQQKFLCMLGIFISANTNEDRSVVPLEDFFKFTERDIDTLKELIGYNGILFTEIPNTEDENNNFLKLTKLGELICLYHTQLYIKDYGIPKNLLDEDFIDFTSLITNIKWKLIEDNVYSLDLTRYDGPIYRLEITDNRIMLFEVCKQCKKYVEVFDKTDELDIQEVLLQINKYLKTRHNVLAETHKKLFNMF